MHIFRFIFLICVPLFSQKVETNIKSLDSTQIKLILDSLLKEQSSISLEYHLKSYDVYNNMILDDILN